MKGKELGSKVLIIDSDAGTAKRLASALTQSAFEVMVASPDPAKPEIVHECCPDAIVLKDKPPQCDGHKLCQQIRQLSSIPIILLGDKPENGVYLETKTSVHWNYYMQWPVSYAELAARIKVLVWRYAKLEKNSRKR